MCAVPLVAAEVHSDVNGAYRALATIKFRAYQSSPMLEVINLEYLGLPTVSYFLLGYCSLESRRGQLSDPCLSLTKYRGYAEVLDGTGAAATTKIKPTE